MIILINGECASREYAIQYKAKPHDFVMITGERGESSDHLDWIIYKMGITPLTKDLRRYYIAERYKKLFENYETYDPFHDEHALVTSIC